MEQMQWFFMGVLFTVSVFALAYLSIVVQLKWYAWAGLVTGVLAILFGVGWAGASFLEGVPQSGAMGLTLFSGGGVIIMTLIWRYLVAPGARGAGKTLRHGRSHDKKNATLGQDYRSPGLGLPGGGFHHRPDRGAAGL